MFKWIWIFKGVAGVRSASPKCWPAQHLSSLQRATWPWLERPSRARVGVGAAGGGGGLHPPTILEIIKSCREKVFQPNPPQPPNPPTALSHSQPPSTHHFQSSFAVPALVVMFFPVLQLSSSPLLLFQKLRTMLDLSACGKDFYFLPPLQTIRSGLLLALSWCNIVAIALKIEVYDRKAATIRANITAHLAWWKKSLGCT